MKQQLMYKFFMLLVFTATFISAQKQTKTFNENFNVGDNAILNINTTHTDIEFETWNKNQVAIEVIIEIEGANSKDMEAYFKQNEVKVSGNSKQIDITTGVENAWLYKHTTGSLTNSWNALDFNFPEITAIPKIEFLDFTIDSIHMPPVPPMPVPEFDYEAFKKDGDAYLKKWQKQFDENFGEDFEKKMEAWQAKAEIASKAHEKVREKARELSIKESLAYEIAKNDRRAASEDRQAALIERQQELRERLKHNAEERRGQLFIRRGDSLRRDTIMNFHSTSPNVYYLSADRKGKGDRVKVKKYIKIKMPKSATLKMNVRHGEVKLAENTRNINATLSYSGLLASIIDGDKTIINASYSPVSVQKWNYGKLKVSYSDNVVLNQVNNLTLSSNSSEVTIDNLMKSVFAENNFGALHIKMIANDFSTMNVSMKNGELFCQLPETPFTILINGEDSKLTSPPSLNLSKTKNYNLVMHKGYNMNKTTDKSITITSKYSDVVLE
tara:strand:- start:1465 stop:2958 length:1494 start_codon:yes stop_codon:yes gene_type:complete